MVFGYFWGAAIVLLPLTINIRSSFPSPTFMHQWVFCAMALILLFTQKGFKRDLFLIASIALSLLSFFNIQGNPTVINYHHYFYFNLGLLALLCLKEAVNEKNTETILKFIGASCIISSAWVLANAVKMNPWLAYLDKAGILDSSGGALGKQLITGNLLNPSTSSLYIAIASIGLLSRPILLLIPAVAIYALGSFGGAAVFFCGCGIYFIDRFIGKKASMVFASILFLSVALLPLSGIKFFSDSGRIEIWSKSLAIYSDFDSVFSWLFGKGVGFYSNNFSSMAGMETRVDHPHNEFIAALFSFGLVGVLLIISAFVVSFKSKNQKARAWMASIMLSFLYMFPLHIAPIAVLILTIFIISIKTRSVCNGFFSK